MQVMKQILISVIIFIYPFFCGFAQNQKELARFYATHATHNGIDISEQVLSKRICTVFYESDGVLCMANISNADNTQSYGNVYNLKSHTYPETSTEYKVDVFYFHWNYINDYESKKGTCKIEFSKIYKPQGILSKLKMITESLDVIEYTGYMEGSLDFSQF